MHKDTTKYAENLLARDEAREIMKRVSNSFSKALEKLQLDKQNISALETVYIPLAAALCKHADSHKGTLIVGINGAQGSGKSTLCEFLTLVLHEGFNRKVTAFSIDDIYLTRSEREYLADTVHPLLRTRGVPGTHDTELGIQLLHQLSASSDGEDVIIPIFDKAIDDRLPADRWLKATPAYDIVLFEGWCVGTTAQEDEELAVPINPLEEDDDRDSTWRRYVNTRLKAEYAELFGMLDLLVMLKIPDMSCVYEWRRLQERKLAQTRKNSSKTHLMDDDELKRFVMHYERLTRHNLQEIPERADILLDIGRNQQIEKIQYRLVAGQTS